MKHTELMEGAREVAKRLTEAGHQAYFAGGCVRDLLLGFEPKDFDIATDARPEEVRRLFRRRVEVGAAFGVVRVLLEDGREYEVATFRTEGEYEDGRRPDHVEYSSSADEDVQRRDFTINALLMDPKTEGIIDRVEGRKDLEAGVVRAVGDAHRRFKEDRLRMLRAVRFSARLGFLIEAETWTAMKAHASELRVVSRERVVAELHGIWLSSRPGRGLALLRESGLLRSALPFLSGATEETLVSLETRLARLPELLFERDALLVVAWTLHLDAVPAEPAEPWGHRLVQDFKLSRSLARAITDVLAWRSVLIEPDRFRTGRCRQLLIAPEWASAFGFLRAREGGASPAVEWWRDAEREMREHPPALDARLGGDDLRTLGLSPGPAFKEILEAVELEVLEGRLSTKEESLAWVRAQN